MEKHHHYQKQLEISHQKLKHVEGTGDKEHLSQNKEKYAMLEEKTKELGYKVGSREASTVAFRPSSGTKDLLRPPLSALDWVSCRGSSRRGKKISNHKIIITEITN